MNTSSLMGLEQFQRLAESYNVIPVSKTLLADTMTPVSAYLRLRGGNASSFLLESVEGGERFGRYSFIGCNPIKLIRCRGFVTNVHENGSVRTLPGDFFQSINAMIAGYRHPPLTGLPRFTGGLVGFIGYDAVRFIEKIPETVTDTLHLDDSILGLFTSIVAFDHLKHQLVIIVNALTDGARSAEESYANAAETVAGIEALLAGPEPPASPFRTSGRDPAAEIAPEQFREMVRTSKRHITDGDIFQVVLSQRFGMDFTGDPFNVYRALRVINPSPYLYYLDLDGTRVIGSSPEILVRKEGARAEVYPIAGTRPRGRDEEEDRRLEAELLADEKERAEHVMLIDLGRNDLGRVCEPGSVKVDQLMTVVRYSHVMHIASRVTGMVPPSSGCVDVLKATFPAGTVSGAPKIRAMEIIDALEPSRRGFYAGGVGYLDFTGNMDMCIAIRTMVASGERITFQAGAGIVADSDPEREYQETLNKSRALVEALKLAEEIR